MATPTRIKTQPKTIIKVTTSFKNTLPRIIPDIGTINNDVVALTGPILLIKNICPI